jgi:hypothetical protein
LEVRKTVLIVAKYFFVQTRYWVLTCLARDSAEARCPPPVSEERNNTFIGLSAAADV